MKVCASWKLRDDYYGCHWHSGVTINGHWFWSVNFDIFITKGDENSNSKGKKARGQYRSGVSNFERDKEKNKSSQVC